MFSKRKLAPPFSSHLLFLPQSDIASQAHLYVTFARKTTKLTFKKTLPTISIPPTLYLVDFSPAPSFSHPGAFLHRVDTSFPGMHYVLTVSFYAFLPILYLTPF